MAGRGVLWPDRGDRCVLYNSGLECACVRVRCGEKWRRRRPPTEQRRILLYTHIITVKPIVVDGEDRVEYQICIHTAQNIIIMIVVVIILYIDR